jgi:hypothetical protein
MFSGIFSKRYRLRATPEGLLFADVPERARIGLYHIIEEFFQAEYENRFLDLYRRICVALRIRRDRSVYEEWMASRAIEDLVMRCEWWQVYDICEVAYASPSVQRSKADICARVNQLLAEELLGFEFRDGLVEKVGAAFIDAQVKEARYLLKEPKFKGADEHFEKALKAVNIRPNPDVENCIKDAVSSIESVGRILANDERALLSDIIKDMARKGTIPKPLDEAIQKVYAYRGNQPGVAHGLVGDSKVTIDEAEFVLAMSAAVIIYLVNKHKNT